MMTLSEFKAWFDGYTFAGGNDVEVIKAKLAEVWAITISPEPYLYPIINPIDPYHPWSPNVPFIPTIPTYPWSPTTWCGINTSGTYVYDPEITTIAYNA